MTIKYLSFNFDKKIFFSCFRISLVTLLSLLPSLVSPQSSLKPFEYNLTQYTRTLPDDLRTIVQKALAIERQATVSGKWSSTLCQPEVPIDCPAMKFRKPSGECNNVRHPKWGNRGQKFLRYLPPSYADSKYL